MSQLFEAALGNQMIPSAAIGWEPTARAVRLLLARDLNDEIDRQADQWSRADLLMQEMGLDPGVGQVDVEHVSIGHLHEGPHESLFEADASAFPNVSMMAYLNAPSGVQDHSYLTVSDLTLYVETMVVAGPVPAGLELQFETIVHRRITRTTEAVNNVIQSDATLLGTVQPQQLPPRGGIGRQSWIKNDKHETGDRFIWHGSRLQYTLQRASTRGRS